MGFRQVGPGEGAKGKRVHFRYVSTEAGGKPWPAWIAGPCHWFMCHCKGRTKPCLHWFTRGELKCDRCSALDVAEETGYQPLYRDVDGVPVMVIVHSASREKIDALKFRSRVNVSRGPDKADGVVILPQLGSQQWYETTLKERHREADLTETLLRVWKIPELVAWYQKENPSDNAMSLPAEEPKTSDGKPFSPMGKAAAKKYGKKPAPELPAADVFDAATNRLKSYADRLKPSENGNHKPGE